MGDGTKDGTAGTAPGSRRKLPKAKRGRPFSKGNTLGQKFKPGESGNPEGTPASAKETQDYASRYSIESVEALVAGMRQKKNLPERRLCAVALLDRAGGKPAQPITGDDDGDPVRIDAGGMVGLLRKLAGETTE